MKNTLTTLGRIIMRLAMLPARLLPWNFPMGDPSDNPVQLTWLIGLKRKE